MQGIQAARVIGGAGTGKTTMMMEIAEKALERPETGGNPFAIGFSSFTRAARSEAAGRAAAAWGMSQGELESHGWFKTCHSVAYKQLGVTKAEVLGGGDENDRWISEALGSDVQCSVDEDDGGVALYIGDPVAAAALNYWSFARSMVVPLRQIVEADNSPDAPGADEVIKRIKMYETAKRLDGRTDFTDMLCRFAGVRNDPKTGPQLVTPEGLVPDEVVGWIFDEAQDASKLLDMACRRLLTGNSCKWAWVVGDPFQVLYSWAGASSSYFMSWDVGKNQKIMPKSYRCAKPILDLGERCLERLHKDYWKRGIAAADHDGCIEESENFEDDLTDIDPREETLVIARTNRHVAKIAAILDDVGVPFRRVKAKKGTYNRDLGMTALWKLQHGEPATGEEWTQAIDMLPSKTRDGRTWLERGSKSQWNKGLKDRFDLVFPEDLSAIGATDHLRDAVASGEWSGLPDGGTKWASAAKRYGIENVSNPKVRIGTIHAVKGQEASKVILLSSVGRRIREGEEDSAERHDEERRIEYVAVTRAKHKLIVAHDPRERYRMEMPI
jgi:superfamily I DNA/RNA helicase